MTNTWTSFGSGLKFTESTLDQPVGGTSLGKGTHEGVTLVGIAPMSNNLPGCKVTFELDGLSREEGIFYENFKKDGLNFKFISFLQAAISNPTLRHKVVQALSADITLMNRFVGNVKATIIVDYPKLKELGKKYSIVNVAESGYKIVDAFDGVTEPEETAGKVYGTSEEAKEARKEFNLAGLYLQVAAIKPFGSDEERAERDQRIEELFFSKPKVVSGDTF